MMPKDLSIPARDGYMLATTCYQPEKPSGQVILINSATAVPRRFYHHFATFLAEQGFTVFCYDYRGIADSRPDSLLGFVAQAQDWALLDMAGVVDWISTQLRPKKLFFIGHSFGGQTAGLLENSDKIDGMVTFSSQSGYWGMQGGGEKPKVFFYVHVVLPLLSHLFGYMPWSWFGSAEDLPKGVALQWSYWCRHSGYLLDDETLPLERYQQFCAPVLAYSIDDDDWGTARAVDAMMTAYPNLTRNHIVPSEFDLKSMGHFGFFRRKSKALWPAVVEWLHQQTPSPEAG